MNFIKKELINYGWSNETKYYVETNNQEKYLLRIYRPEYSQKCHHDFLMHKQLESLNIPIPKAIKQGVCNECEYILQSWINGQRADNLIDSLNAFQQYQYGIEAGQILKKIHSIEFKNSQENWNDFFNNKINRKIQNYNNCPLKLKHEREFLDVIESSRYLLKNRPYTFLHGDYHLGNMMINENNQLYIIDFDRCDYGDPYNEFDRMHFNTIKSHVFATGMINGYFNYNIPDDFWLLIKLYNSINQISALPWAIPFGQQQIEIMTKLAEQFFHSYSNFKNDLFPNWYIKNIESELKNL